MNATPAGRIDWAATLAEHDRLLRVAVLARLGERQAVEEVMQEVALAAVSGRAPLVDPMRAGAWLYRLAVRQALLYRRRHGRQRRLVGRFAERVAAAPPRAADPLDWLVRDERSALVRRALDALPRRDSEILVLKYLDGWTARDLAARLGLGPAAVDARLHRARRRLRDLLAASLEIEVPG